MPGTHQQQLEKKYEHLKLSNQTRTIVGLDPSRRDFNSAMAAARCLGRTLNDQDIEGLLLFINTYAADEAVLHVATLNALKNTVLEILIRQKKVPASLGVHLVSMFDDKRHDEVWRDYCIQYMMPYYQKLALKYAKISTQACEKCVRSVAPRVALGEDVSKYREVDAAVNSDTPFGQMKTIEQTMWRATDETSSSIAGTALIGLETLSRQHSHIDRNQIAQKALHICAETVSGEASRITAMRLCALMKHEEVLDYARYLAATGETIPLKLAAIATVADFGEWQDIEFLKSFLHADTRIQKIVRCAVRQLEAAINNK